MRTGARAFADRVHSRSAAGRYGAGGRPSGRWWGSSWVSGAAGTMPARLQQPWSWGSACWGQAGQQHRVAKPHMATMCMGIRAAVKDMSPVQHVQCPRTTRTRICLAFWYERPGTDAVSSARELPPGGVSVQVPLEPVEHRDPRLGGRLRVEAGTGVVEEGVVGTLEHQDLVGQPCLDQRGLYQRPGGVDAGIECAVDGKYRRLRLAEVRVFRGGPIERDGGCKPVLAHVQQ